jgi:putative transposase
MQQFSISERRVCGFFNIPRSMVRYRAHPRDDSDTRSRLRDLASRHSRWGCPILPKTLRQEGRIVNHKKTHRIYKDEHMGLRLKRRRIRLHGSGVPLATSHAKNEIWSLDFMSESFESGRKFRLLNILDEGTRQSLLIHCGVSIRAVVVVHELEALGAKIGFPKAVRVDNGPEFRSRRFQAWARYRGIRPLYIDPGQPAQNAYIESFNARVRLDCLNCHSWPTLEYAQAVLQQFLKEYNSQRPHSSLGDLTPDAYAARLASLRLSRRSASLAAPHLTPSAIVTSSLLPNVPGVRL